MLTSCSSRLKSQRLLSSPHSSRRVRVWRALPEQQELISSVKTAFTEDQVRVTSSRARRQQDNAIIVGLVSLLTETLRALGVGRARYQELASSTSSIARLPKGDVEGVTERLKDDFKRGYFVTGLVDDTIYAEDCWFADPTVSFTGLQLYKRNLQLLVPFLVQPSVQLRGIQPSGIDESGRQMLRAEWELTTVLSLPWRPRISILGATDYTLGPDSNMIVEHVESWSVSGAQALAQMLRPGKQINNPTS